MEEIASHNRKNDCWLVINGVVCDVTSFISKHPGGENLIMKFAGGKNCDEQWNQIHERNVIYKCEPCIKILGKLK